MCRLCDLARLDLQKSDSVSEVEGALPQGDANLVESIEPLSIGIQGVHEMHLGQLGQDVVICPLFDSLSLLAGVLFLG